MAPTVPSVGADSRRHIVAQKSVNHILLQELGHAISFRVREGPGLMTVIRHPAQSMTPRSWIGIARGPTAIVQLSAPRPPLPADDDQIAVAPDAFGVREACFIEQDDMLAHTEAVAEKVAVNEAATLL